MKKLLLPFLCLLLLIGIHSADAGVTDFEDLALSDDSYYNGSEVESSHFEDLTLSDNSYYNGSEVETTAFEDLLLSSDSYYNGSEVQTIDFEDRTLASNSFYDGSDGGGHWASNNIMFSNHYDPVWGSWDGFAYSNRTDTSTPGFTNQFSAITGAGVDNSSTYCVGYVGWASPPTVTLPEARVVGGAYFTNSTYAYLSIQDGDQFSKQFGGDDGTDPDWFILSITGKDENGDVTGTKEFYLADFRSDTAGEDYILNQWTWVDLSGLGSVKTLEFTLSSSDVGTYGMNTPAYFCMDNLTLPAGNVSGRVTTATEIVGYKAGIMGATATLVGTGGFTTSVSTDENGVYTFEDIPVGIYTLQIDAPAFDAQTVSGVSVTFRENPAMVVRLDQSMPPQGTPGDATGDDKLGLDDVIYILQVLSGVKTQPAP